MRKNNIRRWLHCALDFLPLFLIPVFMIYSHRHDITERTDVDIQYKYQSNEVNTQSDLIIGNLYHFKIDNDRLDNVFDMDSNSYFYASFININSYNFENYNFNVDDLIRHSYLDNGFISINLSFQGTYNCYLQVFFTENSDNDYLISFDLGQLSNNFTLEGDFVLIDINLHGIYTNPFSQTDYNVIESVTVDDTKSDIMTVFTNDFYNATHTYFNMDSVINLGQVYNWFETNLFGGNVPIGIHAVWHIISYEFVMDIIFLVYSVFMFIIDFTEKFLSSMYDKSFGGGR